MSDTSNASIHIYILSLESKTKKILALSFSLSLLCLKFRRRLKCSFLLDLYESKFSQYSLCLFSLCSSSSLIIHTFALRDKHRENINHNRINTIMSAKIFLRRLTDMSTFNTLQDKLTRLNNTYLVSIKYNTYRK
jgi:hypothetical protein